MVCGAHTGNGVEMQDVDQAFLLAFAGVSGTIRPMVDPPALSDATVTAEPCTASDIPVAVGVSRADPRPA